MIMRHLILIMTIALVSCASPYGSFIKSAPATLNDTLAADTVKHLVTLYPPASTHLIIGQATSDAYGKALVKLLRTKGYAVKETESTTLQLMNKEPDTGGALMLRYVLDTPANFYRLTVMVDQKSFTRAYLEQNNVVTQAGAWVQREQ